MFAYKCLRKNEGECLSNNNLTNYPAVSAAAMYDCSSSSCLGLDLLHWVPDLSFSPPHSAAKEKRRGILLIFTAYSEQTTTFGQMSEIIQ